MAQAKYQTETEILKSVASSPSCRWLWTKHVLQRMTERGILAPDIQHALINGHVELIERKADDVWRIRGKDLDGNPITIACVIFEDSIRVVSAF